MAAPTRTELEAAYRGLAEAGVEVICDLSLSCLATIVRGSPPHDPTRYSDGEVRLARAVLVLAAEREELRVDRDAVLDAHKRHAAEAGSLLALSTEGR